jgi:hypothetical protein
VRGARSVTRKRPAPIAPSAKARRRRPRQSGAKLSGLAARCSIKRGSCRSASGANRSGSCSCRRSRARAVAVRCITGMIGDRASKRSVAGHARAPRGSPLQGNSERRRAAPVSATPAARASSRHGPMPGSVHRHADSARTAGALRMMVARRVTCALAVTQAPLRMMSAARAPCATVVTQPRTKRVDPVANPIAGWLANSRHIKEMEGR